MNIFKQFFTFLWYDFKMIFWAVFIFIALTLAVLYVLDKIDANRASMRVEFKGY